MALLIALIYLAQIHGGSTLNSSITSTLNNVSPSTSHIIIDSSTSVTAVTSTSQVSSIKSSATSVTPSSSSYSVIPSSPEVTSYTPPLSSTSTFLISPSLASHIVSSSNSGTPSQNATIPTPPTISITSGSASATLSSASSSSKSFHPQTTNSQVTPTKSSKLHPSSSVSPQKVIVECGEECKSLKKRLWAAGVFAVLFGVTSLIFMFLLFRQCRISKEYNDPALSRLI